MKYVSLIIGCCFWMTTVNAQSTSDQIISLGYFGQAAYQPGVRLSWQKDLKSLNGNDLKSTSLFIQPSLAFSSRPLVHSSLLATIELGYRRVKLEKEKFMAFSVGLGYLSQWQVTDIRVQLSDGSLEKSRERWGYFLPTINYGIGDRIGQSRFGWYGKISVGQKLFSEQASATIFFIELGAQYYL